MDDKLNCESLMQFTGLDQETTMIQILPYLKSIKTKAEVVEYLGSLIGPGPKQTSFVQRFLGQRFQANQSPSKNQNKLDSAFPSLQSTHKSSSSSSLPTLSSNLGAGFPIKNRAAGSSTKQAGPPKTESSKALTVDPKILNNFGNSANVYIKSRDSDDSVTRLSKKRNAKSNPSGSVTPETRLEAIATANGNNLDKIESMREPAPQTDSKANVPPDIDIPISELSPSTLKELLQLKAVLDSFESQASIPKGTAQCFCEARSHGLPIGRLPKQCANCGLIYCRLKPALSACPSCAQPTPLSTNTDLKDIVLREFLDKRNHLIKLEIDKYQKRISLEELKRVQAQEADRAYPSLPTTSKTHSHNHHQQQQQAAKYSNQLNPTNSIQNRIKLGYERLAEEHNPRGNTKISNLHNHQHQAHTILRLNSSNGKTNIIKTTTKKSLNTNESLSKDQKLLNFNQAFDHPAFLSDRDNPPIYKDPFDDLLKPSSDSQPSPFIQNKYASSLAPLPDYVPVEIYQV